MAKSKDIIEYSHMLGKSVLETNDGQLQGLQKNPRFIKDEKFAKLKHSLEQSPEFLKARPLLVYPLDNGHYIIVGGNMRFLAGIEVGITEFPCYIFPKDTTVDKLREYVIKDNLAYGSTDWELIANEWNTDDLEDWGMDIPDFLGDAEEEEPQEQKKVDEDDYDPDEDDSVDIFVKEGEIWQCGDHKLLCGDSTKAESVKRLMGAETAQLWLTDPPYNVGYGIDNHQRKNGDAVLNDKQDEESFRKFLDDAFIAVKNVMDAGAAYYIFHSDQHSLTFRQALVDISDMLLRQCLIWNKNSMVMGRQDYQWKHEPCQPAGTMVLTPTGEKAIETLKDGDVVISWDSLGGQVVGFKNGGYKVKTANREYDGMLYSISVGNKVTKTTDNHRFSIRFNANAKKKYCTYLMKRGNWWRVGQTKAYDARQFGLKTRMHQENADAIWLIAMYEDKLEAQVAEQVLTCKYGIPYTIWNPSRFADLHYNTRNEAQIKEIYDALDLAKMNDNAIRLLHDFNRSEKYPLITKEMQGQRFSTRVTAKIAACNLVPELMQVPIPVKRKWWGNFEWAEITNVTAEPYKGTVYSLAVDKFQHYVADGIITHNCLYGWKEGAGHSWYGDRKQTTVIDWDRPTKSDMHPTMKPVGLFGYLMQNSSKVGDIVIDTFGGSGTTMIAAEQLGRKARLMELSPKYCSVIITRWEKLTGKKAARIEEGENG